MDFFLNNIILTLTYNYNKNEKYIWLFTFQEGKKSIITNSNGCKVDKINQILILSEEIWNI